MSNNITIKTIFRKKKTDKSIGTIYLRINLSWGSRRDKLEKSSRYSIKPSQFKGGNEPVKGSGKESDRINIRVRKYIDEIYDLFDEYKAKSDTLSKDVFDAIIDNKVFNIKSVIYDDTNYLHDQFDRYVRLHTTQMGESRKTRYEFVKNKVKEFCKDEFGNENFDIRRLNSDFHNQFKNYLYECYDYAVDTVNNYMKVLDAAVRYAVQANLIDRYPFLGCTYSYSTGDIKFLKEEELKRIKNTTFRDERVQFVADVFVFAAHTGMAHTDLSTMTCSNITQENGSWVIKKKRNKTDVLCTIPLDSEAIRILNKYQNNPLCAGNNKPLPVLYINEYNDCLKRIADKCNISLNLSSHVARHTMATTNWLDKGGSLEVLQSILGHKSIRTTQRYGKINNKRIIDEASRVYKNTCEEGSLYPDKRMINQS